jgi:hypothetical protein
LTHILTVAFCYQAGKSCSHFVKRWKQSRSSAAETRTHAAGAAVAAASRFTPSLRPGGKNQSRTVWSGVFHPGGRDERLGPYVPRPAWDGRPPHSARPEAIDSIERPTR